MDETKESAEERRGTVSERYCHAGKGVASECRLGAGFYITTRQKWICSGLSGRGHFP